ncbi:MAG: hypothetical protein PHC54_04270 [Candidatus Omnitrophica bacterium]|nr:hypothetical protein [Candidatus Omnitrophota bacterium]MDD5592509.1 hypothetical protein [Candidatus Omnitrophota bacterium]
MAEDIKSLIDKINQEGIAAAEKKAKEIEEKTRQEAERVLAKAKREASSLLNNAKEQILKMREEERASLTQAGRDLLLTLKQEVNIMLQKIIVRELRDMLTPENLFKILSSAIKGSCVKEKTDIIISLNKEDLKALESGFLAKLKAETKKEILLRPSESIGAGFVISFDAGKSQFDFSEKALAEYIGAYLKPKLKEILKS